MSAPKFAKIAAAMVGTVSALSMKNEAPAAGPVANTPVMVAGGEGSQGPAIDLLSQACVRTSGPCWEPTENVQMNLVLEYCANPEQHVRINKEMTHFRKHLDQFCLDVAVSVCEIGRDEVKDPRWAEFNGAVTNYIVTGSYTHVQRLLTIMIGFIHNAQVETVDGMAKFRSLEPRNFQDHLTSLMGECVMNEPKDMPQRRIDGPNYIREKRIALFPCRKTGGNCWNPKTPIVACVQFIFCLQDCYRNFYQQNFKQIIMSKYRGEVSVSGTKHFQDETPEYCFGETSEGKKHCSFEKFWTHYFPTLLALGHNEMQQRTLSSLVRFSTTQLPSNSKMLKEFLDRYTAVGRRGNLGGSVPGEDSISAQPSEKSD